MKHVKTKDIVLGPVIPSAAIEAKYRRKLYEMVEAMHNSIKYWVEAKYRNNSPEIALDESPANLLQSAIRRLVRRWQRKFNTAATELADYFAEDISKRSDKALKDILKKGGISVDFTMTRAQRDIIDATVHQNVSLIKSIPSQYLTQVEGIVMRSVQTGNDLKQLSDDLQKQFGVAKRRANFIARDQNAKATSALNRSRQIELGITEAIWMHSSAGKVPRPTHVKNDGEKYDVNKGWFDPAVGKHIFPGELPNCRCFSKSIIKGFE